MAGVLHLDYTQQGRRPTASQIVGAWKKHGKEPLIITVTYGETFAAFEYMLGARRWDDSGNGCRGVDRLAVVKALTAASEKS